MEKIKSFQKNHNLIVPGFYLSTEMHGIKTFDVRFKKPNADDFLMISTMHTIEHIMATLLRNSEQKDNIIYFGPMGCRTGFYLLTINMTGDEAKQLFVDCLKQVDSFDEVPGSKKEECGNYKDHNLLGAKKECAEFLKVIE